MFFLLNSVLTQGKIQALLQALGCAAILPLLGASQSNRFALLGGGSVTGWDGSVSFLGSVSN